MPEESRRGLSNGSFNIALLDNTGMVHDSDESFDRQSLPQTGAQHPLRRKMRLMACKLSGQVSCRDMFLARQPKSSSIPGQPYFQTWLKLCREWEINPYDPPLTKVLDFLTSLYERGLKYDAINTAKSAVSAITQPKNSLTLGNQPLISRFMKRVLRSRLPVPRYESTWDVQVVLCLPWLYRTNWILNL
jgi:hypothetical protein